MLDQKRFTKKTVTNCLVIVFLCSFKKLLYFIQSFAVFLEVEVLEVKEVELIEVFIYGRDLHHVFESLILYIKKGKVEFI